MKLDILAIMAHPDDAELACAGTLISHKAMGKKTGVVDYTRGELGTRGTPEIRLQEAKKAAEIMNLDVRENLGFRDGFFQNDEAHQLEVIKMIRKYKPEIVIANAPSDRHPDHGRGSALTVESAFKSGLKMIETELDGEKQEAWRPKFLYHIVQSVYLPVDLVVDVTPYWEQKKKAIFAYESQFYTPQGDNSGDQTFISSPSFLNMIEARGNDFGKAINVDYGEGFIKGQQLGVKDLFSLV